jgi:hypothetical protein
MANHIRKQIRDALIIRVTGLVTTATRVFGNRMEMISDAELPALLVMNDSEQIVARAIGSQAAPHARMEQRTITFKVRGVVKANSALDDTLDQICKEVEIAISADIFFAGLTDDARLVSTNYQLDAAGEKPVGIADMIWEFDTWAANTAPDVRV